MGEQNQYHYIYTYTRIKYNILYKSEVEVEAIPSPVFFHWYFLISPFAPPSVVRNFKIILSINYKQYFILYVDWNKKSIEIPKKKSNYKLKEHVIVTKNIEKLT